MFPFQKKVHPEQRYLTAATRESLESSSSSSSASDSDYDDPTNNSFEEEVPSSSIRAANSSSVSTPTLNDAQRKALDFWEEALEDFEILLEENFGKSDLYIVEGIPLKASTSDSAVGLHLITDQVMKAYGLEFHSLIDGIFTEEFVAKGLMGTIVPDLKRLNVKGSMCKKLIVWIKDDPVKLTDPKHSYCRMLMGELLRRDVEPHFLLACNDLDDEILSNQLDPLADKKTPALDKQTSDFKTIDTVVLNNIFLAVLHLSLAAKQCKLIIVDCNDPFLSESQAHALLTYAEHLKHRVYFLPASPTKDTTESDRRSQIFKAVKHIEKWYKGLPPSSNAWKKAAYAAPELSINEMLQPPTPPLTCAQSPSGESQGQALGEPTPVDDPKPGTSKSNPAPELDQEPFNDDEKYISNSASAFLPATPPASLFPPAVELDAKSAMEIPLQAD